MNDDPDRPEASDLFQPVPHALRRLVWELDPPPTQAFTELPGWARTLVHHHSRDNLDLDRLVELALEPPADDGSLSIGFEGSLIELFPGGESRSFASNPKTVPGMGDWMYAKLTDYWDTRVGAIERAAERLEALEEAGRAAALSEIEAAVTRHVEAMSDDWLIHVCLPFADDLYKAANWMGWWNADLEDYLAASAGTFSRLLADRGIQIQYLIDNQWEDPTAAIELFLLWFRAAGFNFICPQDLARQFAMRDGARGDDEIAARAPVYTAEARREANVVAGECQQLGGHFVHLDADSEPNSWDKALERRGAPGVVTIQRDAAPLPGSTVGVWNPEGYQSPAE